MTACVRAQLMRGTISNVFLRLERQTTTFKDRLSLFLMIFTINIIKIVYIDDIHIWATYDKTKVFTDKISRHTLFS